MNQKIDYKQKIESFYNNVLSKLDETNRKTMLNDMDLKNILANSIKENSYPLFILRTIAVLTILECDELALEQCEIVKNYTWRDYTHLFNLNYATTLLNNNLYDQAEKLFVSIDVNKTMGNYFVYFSNYGVILMMLSKHSEAIEKLELAMQYPLPNNHIKYKEYINLNFCYRQIKQYDKALFYIEKVIKEIPNNLNMFNKYIFTYKEMGDKDKVKQLLASRQGMGEYSNEDNFINIHQTILLGDNSTAYDLIRNNIKNHINQHPKYIYQYKPVDSAIKSIIGEYIYANNPNSFNDHCDPYYRLLPLADKLYYQPISNKLGIACLTTNHTSLLMWSHYAQSHKGICLEYNIEADLASYALCQIDYSGATLKNIFNTIYEDRRGNYKEKSFIQQLSTKPKEWAYENEYRLIKWVDEESHSNRCIMAKIKTIYLGKEISESDKETIKQLCHSKNINCYQMETDENDLWKLVAKPVCITNLY